MCVCVRVWMARHSLVVWYFNFDILQKHGLLATVRWNWNLFFICRIGNVMNEKYLPNTFRFGCASFPYLGPFACFVEWSVEAKKERKLHEIWWITRNVVVFPDERWNYSNCSLRANVCVSVYVRWARLNRSILNVDSENVIRTIWMKKCGEKKRTALLY